MRLNGSDILFECLLEQGVDTIFGFPGGAVLNLYDALYRYKDAITHVLTSHEQGAAHAADGYARSTGKAGVCLATSGPGATNLVTGIATAYMDSVPVVAITGNVTKPLLGKDSFQEVDIAGVTTPITKHNFIVKDVDKLADTVRRAFYIAREGRPGPVLIDITKDVTAAFAAYTPQTPAPVPRKTETIRAADVDAAVSLICASRKPLILAGGGVISAGASAELLAFAERVDAPVTLTSMGLGGFPASNPRFIGMIGMHGSRASNISAMRCDLLVAVGTRFSDRVTGNTLDFAPNAKILHIEIDPAEINKNTAATGAILGDLREALARLNARLERQNHADWTAAARALFAEFPYQYKQDGALRPQMVLEAIGRLTKGGAIITTDVGQHQMFACQFIKHERPRHFITSGGLGTMGFGLGAAIGASFGNPGKTIVNISGDGCFRMNCVELATAVEYNVPVVDVIMNNHALGMVRQWQDIFYDKRFSHTTLNKTTDFVKLAEAYRAAAFTIAKPENIEPVLKQALALNRPAVVNVEIGSDEKVFPMVPAGARIDEFVDEN